MRLNSEEVMIKLQPASEDTYQTKYQLKELDGTPVDEDIEDTFKRVAKALSSVEGTFQHIWEERFLWALRNGAIPAGRILSNAGAEKLKPNVSLINCTVSGNIPDSISGIGQMVGESMETLTKGCGIGYCFSSLRPKGALVGGVGATTSGSLSFMNIFDSSCFTISSAGGRRG
jgi:ribonucleoside-diphosphate reductase alpha chain